MSLSRLGLVPKSGPRKLAGLAVLAVAALAAGCSNSKHTHYHYPGDPHVNAQMPAQSQHARVRKPDLEDDGLEAQPEPPRHRIVEPDDPSEPFSPNYGNRPGDPPQRQIEPPRRAPPPGNGGPKVKVAIQEPIPDDLPAYFKQRLASTQAD